MSGLVLWLVCNTVDWMLVNAILNISKPGYTAITAHPIGMPCLQKGAGIVLAGGSARSIFFHRLSIEQMIVSIVHSVVSTGWVSGAG